MTKSRYCHEKKEKLLLKLYSKCTKFGSNFYKFKLNYKLLISKQKIFEIIIDCFN